RGNTGVVTSVALSGDGKHVVTGCGDSTATLWSAADGKNLQTFRGLVNEITGVAPGGNGKHVVTLPWHKPVLLGQTDGDKKLPTFPGHASFVASAFQSGGGDKGQPLIGYDNKIAIRWD